MKKLLAFDSLHIVSPIRQCYLGLLRYLCRSEEYSPKLILYRLDRNNEFLNHPLNISGDAVGIHREEIDALSILFYRHLKASNKTGSLRFKGVLLFDLYTRQLKLKLEALVRCAFRIRTVDRASDNQLIIITDRQTASIMRLTLSFLEIPQDNIIWRCHPLLTFFVSVNSFVMRMAALMVALRGKKELPPTYYYKEGKANSPTVLITMPKRRPEVFFSSYVKDFGEETSVVLYSLGCLEAPPPGYIEIEVKAQTGHFEGFFVLENLCFTSVSYIDDVLLIYKKHADLSVCIDVANQVFTHDLDAHISRLQTSVVDNLLALKARHHEVFILGDVFEEIYDCDAAICSCPAEHTRSLNLACAAGGLVKYRGGNSLMRYRLNEYRDQGNDYLRELLNINASNTIIFYASDPSKEEAQRYLTEKALIGAMALEDDCVLVIKTHPQDSGTITGYSYVDAGSPENVVLIGDYAQVQGIKSDDFLCFESFDFNSAIASSDGFLTSSSSSILQALILGVKTGVVDTFSNGYYDYLTRRRASYLITDNASLKHFLVSNPLQISDETLRHCGLDSSPEPFDIVGHLNKQLEARASMY